MDTLPADHPARESLLDRASFSDTFSIRVRDAKVNARQAAVLAFDRPPKWITGLLALRNFLVSPFGLKTGAMETGVSSAAVGLFPLLAEDENWMVLGLDDRHLDFRIFLTVADDPMPGEQTVSATTQVKTHNLPGKVYLAAVMPFHKIIVPSMLARISQHAGRQGD